MFTLSKSITAVDAYLVKDGNFFICSGNTLRDVTKGREYEVRIGTNIRASELDFSQFLVIRYSDGEGFMMDNNSFFKIPYSVYSARVTLDKVCVYKYDYDLLTPLTNVYDIPSHSLLYDWRIADTIELIDDVVVYKGNEQVTIISVTTKREFKIDISDIGRYKNQWGEVRPAELIATVGVFQDTLWLGITNHTLLGVDRTTGQRSMVIRNIPNFHCSWLPSAIPDSSSMIFDVQRRKIIGFRWEFYWEVDCTTGQVTLTDLTEEFKKAQIRCDASDFGLDGQLIFFLQKRPGKVGVFNVETKKLEWQYSLKDSIIPIKISLNNGYLYLKDSTDSLHVFQPNNIHQSI